MNVLRIAHSLALAVIMVALLPMDARSQFTSSNLPVVRIETNGQEIRQDLRIVATMGITDNGPGQRNYIDDPANHYNGRISIEIRGSSSTSWSKKQYNVETQDETGENLNVPLLGMPAENDWILYAPYIDKSLMRNTLIYRLSNDLGWYASRTRYCELFLNGLYRGVYVLLEKIKRDNNRVNISSLNPDEIAAPEVSGGYIIKVDKPGDGGFYSIYPQNAVTPFAVHYQFHYPQDEDIVDEQAAYIESFMNEFEEAVYAGSPNDPFPAYLPLVNLASFADYFILNELSKNVDGYRLSTFMYKDRDDEDGRLHIGPIWDFNLAFGNANYYDGADTDDWMLEQLMTRADITGNDAFQVPFWWRTLLEDSTFATTVQERWADLRQTKLHATRIDSLIDATADTLQESKDRNFEIWFGPGEGGEGFWPVPEIFYSFDSYEDETGYLKQWIGERAGWIDQHIDDLPLGQVMTLEPPQYFSLSSNFPDPFNGETQIRYEVPYYGWVSAKVYNILGEHIRTIEDGYRAAGIHFLTWDGVDRNGGQVSSGLYFLSVQFRERVLHEKMLYVR